ncbi:T-lymphocyte activation antigen CD80 [Rhynchonycteris naso]
MGSAQAWKAMDSEKCSVVGPGWGASSVDLLILDLGPEIEDPSITQLTKTVKDIAVLSCNYNISTEELTNVRVYWQKGHEVVQTVMPGKMQVSPKYKNRTIIDVTNNLSVVILALRLSDAGRYTCVIQKYEKGSYKVVHLTEVILVIRADFPVPNITDLGTQSTNIRRIICSTSGGFPKPHLSWLENGKELNATKATVSQDPETELYNISSELHFNVANNHNFTCSIKYGDLTVSQIFNWKTLYLKNYWFIQNQVW